jgi:hypothetical protein
MEGHRCLLYFGLYVNKEIALEAALTAAVALAMVATDAWSTP